MINRYGSQCYVKQENGKMGFDKVDLPFYGEVSLANATMFKIGVFEIPGNDRLFVGIEGFGSYTFSEDSHPGYVQEKLGLRAMTDACSVADFIEGQFGRSSQYQENINTDYL